MGLERPKAFLPLGGIPILAHTLQSFEACPRVDEILPLVPEEEVPFCQQEIISRLGLRRVSPALAGGPERGDSVFLGLKAIKGRADIVVIHDGARPFVPQRLITEAIDGARRWKAVVTALPAAETVKEVSAEGEVLRTVDRRRLWMVQTPQSFDYPLLWEAYQKAGPPGREATDDAMLVERLGVPVRIIEGSRFNLKITTSEDLVLAEALLRIKERIRDW